MKILLPNGGNAPGALMSSIHKRRPSLSTRGLTDNNDFLWLSGGLPLLALLSSGRRGPQRPTVLPTHERSGGRLRFAALWSGNAYGFSQSI
jgi:hypothetical protein